MLIINHVPDKVKLCLPRFYNPNCPNLTVTDNNFQCVRNAQKAAQNIFVGSNVIGLVMLSGYDSQEVARWMVSVLRIIASLGHRVDDPHGQCKHVCISSEQRNLYLIEFGVLSFLVGGYEEVTEQECAAEFELGMSSIYSKILQF